MPALPAHPPSASVNCNQINLVGYPSGSPEDLYRQPAGCPYGVDKIPSVYASISAASAAAVPTKEAHKDDDEHEGDDRSTLFWECTDPENPPDWAKGPNGEVRWRAIGCPPKGTPAPTGTWAVGPGTFHSPEPETTWAVGPGTFHSPPPEKTKTAGPATWPPPEAEPTWSILPGLSWPPPKHEGMKTAGPATWSILPGLSWPPPKHEETKTAGPAHHGKEHHGKGGDRASLFWECTDPENPPDWAKGPNGEVRWRAIGCPPKGTPAPEKTWPPNDGYWTAAPTTVD